MRVEHGKIEGGLILQEDLEVHGMVGGNIKVPSGKTLILHGMCLGDVTVDANGVAVVHGMIKGNLKNLGTAELHGMVMGSVNTNGGKFSRSPGSMVFGAVVN